MVDKLEKVFYTKKIIQAGYITKAISMEIRMEKEKLSLMMDNGSMKAI